MRYAVEKCIPKGQGRHADILLMITWEYEC